MFVSSFGAGAVCLLPAIDPNRSHYNAYSEPLILHTQTAAPAMHPGELERSLLLNLPRGQNGGAFTQMSGVLRKVCQQPSGYAGVMPAEFPASSRGSKQQIHEWLYNSMAFTSAEGLILGDRQPPCTVEYDDEAAANFVVACHFRDDWTDPHAPLIFGPWLGLLPMASNLAPPQAGGAEAAVRVISAANVVAKHSHRRSLAGSLLSTKHHADACAINRAHASGNWEELGFLLTTLSITQTDNLEMLKVYRGTLLAIAMDMARAHSGSESDKKLALAQYLKTLSLIPKAVGSTTPLFHDALAALANGDDFNTMVQLCAFCEQSILEMMSEDQEQGLYKLRQNVKASRRNTIRAAAHPWVLLEHLFGLSLGKFGTVNSSSAAYTSSTPQGGRGVAGVQEPDQLAEQLAEAERRLAENKLTIAEQAKELKANALSLAELSDRVQNLGTYSGIFESMLSSYSRSATPLEPSAIEAEYREHRDQQDLVMMEHEQEHYEALGPP